jgi:hypothetical protein
VDSWIVMNHNGIRPRRPSKAFRRYRYDNQLRFAAWHILCPKREDMSQRQTPSARPNKLSTADIQAKRGRS